MAQATITAAMVQPGTEVVDGDTTVTITRRHRGAPRGKVLVSYRRNGGGCGMAEIDDTERLVLA